MALTQAQRAKAYRGRKRDGERDASEAERHENVTPVTAGGSQSVTVGLDDYLSRPEAYATRAEPESLNWGPYMDCHALKEAGLRANRVPVPGDWDYAGVAQEATV